MIPDGRVADSGEVLEIDPQKRLVLKWRKEFQPEIREEGYSRTGTTNRHCKADHYSRDRETRLKADRRCFRRRAADPGELEQFARNRRVAGGNTPLAGRTLIS